jgi:hypothetical protein
LLAAIHGKAADMVNQNRGIVDTLEDKKAREIKARSSLTLITNTIDLV